MDCPVKLGNDRGGPGNDGGVSGNDGGVSGNDRGGPGNDRGVSGNGKEGTLGSDWGPAQQSAGGGMR